MDPVKSLCVVGDPIEHSLSPCMHTAAFVALGQSHTYEAMRVPASGLQHLVDRIRRGELHGANVTIPHKVAAVRLCDFFTDEVGVTGAVNTLHVDPAGRLVGSNTDVDGLRADLLAQDIVPRHALVIGAGGAARAVVVAISSLGATVDIAARRRDQSERLVRDVAQGVALDWESLRRPAQPLEYDLIVNATSAGMSGGPPGEPIAEAFERVQRAADAVVYDTIYRPPSGVGVTPLLVAATRRGHRAIDGVGMFVEQGARSLSIFLATPISIHVRQAMRAAVVAALAARPSVAPM